MARPWTLADLPAASVPGYWFDTQAAASITLNGSKASALADVRANGIVASQTNANLQPDFVADGLNGLPCLRNTSGAVLNITAAMVASKFPLGTVDRWTLLVGLPSAVTSNRIGFGYGANAARQMHMAGIVGGKPALTLYDADYLASTAWTANTGSVLLTDLAAGSSAAALIGFNGARNTTAAMNNGGTGSTGAGQIFNYQGIAPWLGAIGELAGGVGPLSLDDFQRVEGYAAWRWATQALLPANHPYKTTAPMVAGGPTLGGGGGGLILTGRTANLLVGHTLPAAPGLIGLDGRSLQARAARRIASDAGSIALAGQQAALRQARMLFSTGVSISFAGGSAGLLHGYSLPASSGEVATVGGAAQLRRSWQIAAAAGSIQLTGWSASLDRVGRYAVEASGGSTEVAGMSVGLRLRRRLNAAPGTLAVNGAPILLVKPGRYGMIASGTTFGMTGSAAALRAARRLVAADRRIAWEGAPAVLRVSRRLTAAPGSLMLTLRSATLTLGQARPPIVIPLPNRFIVPARQRCFTVPARPRAFIIRKGSCMQSITKYAAEERQYQADWSADLNGQTIASAIVPTSNDPTLIVDRVTHDGPIMKFWLQGGTSGRVATIRFVAPTSGGEDLAWQQTVVVY